MMQWRAFARSDAIEGVGFPGNGKFTVFEIIWEYESQYFLLEKLSFSIEKLMIFHENIVFIFRLDL